MKVFRLLRF